MYRRREINPYRRRSGTQAGGLAAGSILLCLLIFGGSCLVTLHTEQVSGAEVTRTEIKRRSEASDRYLVFTSQGVFTVEDHLIHGPRWNSSDVWGRIEVGDVCSFTASGYRVPFLSMYQNILGQDPCG